MKTGFDRKYTAEFRDSAVKQVMEGGRGMAVVARSLEMSNKTLANWVYLARRGQAPGKPRKALQPVTELEAELSRLRQENSRLRVEKEILKKAAAYFARELM
jgi:transposase